MSIHAFMARYKEVWEAKDSDGFAALFTPDGRYHNTPFQIQDSPEARAGYWDRIKLQDDISVGYEVLAESDDGGIAHWRVGYQVASEELFRIWAQSTGTGLPERRPGDSLPRMILDGVLVAKLAPSGLAEEVRIWWHSMPQPT